MLRENFLKILSDYVSETIAHKESSVMEKEANVFGLLKFTVENKQEKNKLLGLFSEWLVFDRKQDLFDGLTGLQYFVKHNPLRLDEKEISAYRDLESFEVGYFEVKKIEMGRGVSLQSVATGVENFVHDVTASLSLKEENTIWTRIAEVGGAYHMVGSIFFIVPFKIMPGMREAISKWKKNSFNAKDAASLMAAPDSDFEDPLERDETINRDNFDDQDKKAEYQKAKERFKEMLKKCKMDKMLSVETYRKWITNEKRFRLGFAFHALFNLIPTDTTDKDVSDLLDASVNFANLTPKKSLGDKSSQEVFASMRNEEKFFEMDIHSKDKYMVNLEKAHTEMKKGEYQEAYKIFEGVIRDLFQDQTPFFDAFRIYANAAICSLADQKLGLGEELLEAALRVNPLYDFATRTKELEITPYDDFSRVKKGQKKITKLLRSVIKNDGIRIYRRSVFRKYEDFLKKIGVSLCYETHTVPTIYSTGRSQPKIGRNDPCFCASGKKFKKCHGGW